MLRSFRELTLLEARRERLRECAMLRSFWELTRLEERGRAVKRVGKVSDVSWVNPFGSMKGEW